MLLFDAGKKLEKAFTPEQFDALVEVLEKREDRAATKEDLRETELRMQVEIEKIKYSLLKWQIGLAIAIIVIMAKGFGWLGF